MNQFGLQYMYTWKCHNETLHIAILNKQKCLFFFSKTENRKQSRSCLRGWYQWEGEDIKKRCRRVSMVQILCTHICKWKKWDLLKLFQEQGLEGVNSTMIYYKNFCKSQCTPSTINNKRKKTVKREPRNSNNSIPTMVLLGFKEGCFLIFKGCAHRFFTGALGKWSHNEPVRTQYLNGDKKHQTGCTGTT
jgi:hypothetical protein